MLVICRLWYFFNKWCILNVLNKGMYIELSYMPDHLVVISVYLGFDSDRL